MAGNELSSSALDAPRGDFLEPWNGPVAMFGAILALLLARMPERLFQGFLWAEDVSIFIKQGYEHGIGSLWEPYAGYLHTVPRLIVLVFSWVAAPGVAGRVFPWICACVLALSSAYLFAVSRRVLGTSGASVLALSLVLVPQDGEVWLNVTNLQWVLAPVLLVMLWEEVSTEPQASLSAHIARAVVILLLTLTGPFGVIFLPVVAAAHALNPRRPNCPRTWCVLGLGLAAATVQLVLIVTTPELSERGSLRPLFNFGLTDDFLRNFVLELALSQEWTKALYPHWRLLGASLLAVYGACLIGTFGRWRRICAVLTLGACLFWLLGRIRFGDAPGVPMRVIGGSRFLYLPFVLCVWSLAITAEKATATARTAAWLLLLLVALNSASLFRRPPWPPTCVERISTADGVLYRITPPPSTAFSTTVKGRN